MYHRVLQRQMKKFGVRPELLTDNEVAWTRFLDRINRFYHEVDQDRYLLERSLAISSREMQELYDDLQKASESRIAAERDKLRAVISSLGAGLCTLDIAGRVLSINPEGERLLGCTETEVLGRPFFAWNAASGDGQVPADLCLLNEVIASGMPIREEEGVFVREDGTPMPVSYTLNPIQEEGVLLGAVLVFFDVTERKRAAEALRESEEWLRTFVNALPGLALVLDEEGRYVEVYTTQTHLLFNEAEQLKGRLLHEVLPEAAAILFLSTIRQAIESGVPQTLEYKLEVLGGPRWFEGQVAPMHGLVGERRMVIWISHDITERKRAGEALRESEERHRTLLTHLPVGVYRTTPEGRFIEANPAMAELFGVEDVEVLQRLNARPFFLQAEDRDYYVAHLLQYGTIIIDYAIRRKDGEVIWVRDYAQAIEDETDGSIFFDGILVDITERKQAGEALRESEQRFRDLFESSPDAIFVEDLDGNVLDVNPAACRLHDVDAGQLIGRNVRTLVPPAMQEEAMTAFARIVTGEVDRLEGSSWTADGREIPVEIRASRITQDQKTALLMQVRDITERRQAEQRLRLLEASVSASLDGITISDVHQPDFPLIYVSPGFERMTGYSAKEVLGRNCRFLQNDDHDQPALGMIRTALQTETQCRVVLRNYRKDGALFWNELTIYPLHDTLGRLTHYVGIQRDITPRKQVEEALRRSEERYTLAVSAGNVGVWDWNLETNEIYIDPNLKEILGYEDHEIKNHIDDWGRFVHPDDQEKVMVAATAHLEGVTPVYDVEHRMLHRNGSIRWFVARGTAMKDVQGNVVRMVGTDTDITERKQAAQELARINAKLEQRNRELQDFAHVASHDLQEPLRKIRAFADLMQEDYGHNVDETGKYYLNRMEDAATRMARLITDLLEYSRVTTKVRPFAKVDLNSVVADVLSDLEMQIQETGGRITVSNLPTIDADATQMRQLMQNLIGNALKFHKPDVPPMVEVVSTQEKQPTQDGEDAQTMCRLEVRDNGIGFAEKYLDRIFTPFQRLHGRGAYAGTGMGLAICRRIVERHHGTITAHSTLGHGALFVILLPVQQLLITPGNGTV